VTFKHWISAI